MTSTPPVPPAHQCLRSAQMLSSPSSSSFSSSSSSSSPLTVQQREPAGQPAGPAPSSSCDLQNLTLIQQLFKIFFAHEPQQGSEKRAKVRREKGEEIETSWRVCKASCGARARCPSTWQSCSVLTQLTITWLENPFPHSKMANKTMEAEIKFKITIKLTQIKFQYVKKISKARASIYLQVKLLLLNVMWLNIIFDLSLPVKNAKNQVNKISLKR